MGSRNHIFWTSARRCTAWLGKAWLGLEGQGMGCFALIQKFSQGMARLGLARRGMAWQGMAWDVTYSLALA